MSSVNPSSWSRTPPTLLRSCMSAGMTTTLPSCPDSAYACWHCSATWSSAARRRARRTTLEPARANSSAVAAPMPLEAPVTRTGEVSGQGRGREGRDVVVWSWLELEEGCVSRAVQKRVKTAHQFCPPVCHQLYANTTTAHWLVLNTLELGVLLAIWRSWSWSWLLAVAAVKRRLAMPEIREARRVEKVIFVWCTVKCQ